MQRIYLSAPHMSGREQTFVAEAFSTNWVSSVGPNLDAFEHALESLVGAPCVALSSGTAAIHLGLKLLGVGTGDEVLCPTLTFAASCNPVLYERGTPVFIDSDESYQMDPAVVEHALTTKARGGKLPKAMIVVHLFGQSADLDPLRALSDRFGVPILEDAAEALGTHYKGAQVGAFGEVGAVSFNGNKIITTSGGGALFSRNRDWVAKARFWSTQARDPGMGYQHSELGYNYRMSNVLAGVGRAQLEVLEDRVAARRRIAARYAEMLADLDGFRLMPEAEWGRHTRWLTVFAVDPTRAGIDRDALVRALEAEQIEARPVWKPMHMQDLYAGAECFRGETSERLFGQGVCLPSTSSLGEDAQARVIGAIRRAVHQAREARSRQ